MPPKNRTGINGLNPQARQLLKDLGANLKHLELPGPMTEWTGNAVIMRARFETFARVGPSKSLMPRQPENASYPDQNTVSDALG